MPPREGSMTGHIGRREFITLLSGAAVAWPLAAGAQQAAVPVVGVLSAEWPNLFSDRLRAFHDGLRETGYVEGRNLAIEYRWAEGQNDRLPALAAELVRRQVTGRQSHGRGHLKRGGSREAAGAAARVGPHRDHRCAARQPDEYRPCRDDNERAGDGGPHIGA